MNRNKVIQVFLLILAVCLFGSCTTMVNITSEPTAAYVRIFNHEDRIVWEGPTPISVVLRQHRLYNVQFTKEGYNDRFAVIFDSPSPSYIHGQLRPMVILQGTNED